MIVAVVFLIFAFLITTGWLAWLTWDRQAIAERADEASEAADQAKAAAATARADARRAIDHLNDADPGTGRHHVVEPDRPRPYPRTAPTARTTQ